MSVLSLCLLPLLLSPTRSELPHGLDCSWEARRFFLNLRTFLDGFPDKSFSVSCPPNTVVSDATCDHEPDHPAGDARLDITSDSCGIVSLNCVDEAADVAYSPSVLPSNLPDLNDGYISLGFTCTTPLLLGLVIGVVVLLLLFVLVCYCRWRNPGCKGFDGVSSWPSWPSLPSLPSIGGGGSGGGGGGGDDD